MNTHVFAISDAVWELVSPDTDVEQLGDGFDFTEGPVWNRDGSFLLFNDIPASVRRRWSRARGIQQVLQPTNMANGMAYDPAGRLVVCEHATSAVVRESGDGTGRHRTILASHYRGKQLNSPNDVVVAADGAIYFTDPSYGRQAGFGVERVCELDFRGVFRIPPAGGELELLVDDFTQPNGLCFAPDERLLYVNDSELCHIRVFDVAGDGALRNGRLFAEGIRHDEVDGNPDGMKCDENGNVYVTGPGGVWILTPDGTHLGVIKVPETVANLAWGGDDLRDLYLTSSTSLYRIELLARGPAAASQARSGAEGVER